MTRRIRRPSPALVISLIALFVALGGTGYAATKLNGKNIKNKTVSGNALKNKTITGGKLKNNTLTGTQINESKLGKVPTAGKADTATSAGTATRADSAATATTAGTANSAKGLEGAGSNEFRTFSASATAGTLALTLADQTVVSTTITIPVARTITVYATIDVTGDGGDNDNVNCSPEIAGVGGQQISQQIQANSLDLRASLAVSQSRTVGPGTHTVLLNCNIGASSAATVQNGNLSVIATG